MKLVFALANGRSGTLHAHDLFRRHALDCVSRHETYLDVGNPSMFGRPIYDYAVGREDRTRLLLAQ